MSSNPDHGEVYSIQQYVIKFVSDLRHIGGFLRFPPPIKLFRDILKQHVRYRRFWLSCLDSDFLPPKYSCIISFPIF